MDYAAKKIATALRMIAKYGQDVTVRQIRDAAPDPDRPWASVNPAPDPVDHTVKIAFLPVERVEWSTLQYVKDTDIPIGYVTGYLGNNGFRPNMKDVVIRTDQEGTAQLTIDDMVAISPAGTDILYILLLRK